MSDLEVKLRSLNFREPPPALRGAVLSAARSPGWQNWLAPHPVAWLALAALWLALAVLDGLLNGSDPAREKSLAGSATPRPEAPALIAFYQRSGGVEPAL